MGISQGCRAYDRTNTILLSDTNINTVTDNIVYVGFYSGAFCSLQSFTVVTAVYNHNSLSLHMQIKPYFENKWSANTLLYSSESIN
jgi:hypothetical protein